MFELSTFEQYVQKSGNVANVTSIASFTSIDSTKNGPSKPTATGGKKAA